MQLLRLENKSLTQADMQRELKLSKATISRNLKVMEEMNLLKIDLIASEKKNDNKYSYELKENSLFYIVSKFMKTIYEGFNRRMDDNKLIEAKINQLNSKENENTDMKNLLRIMKEEEIVFNALIGKFERMMNELEEEMLKNK